MSSKKPSIFFSHSSKNGGEITRVKELFEEYTSETFQIFVSSDGQSIPFGRNWVHKVEEALHGAKLMFVFVTPESLRSDWLHFESGFAYSMGIRVVPIGFLGIDLDDLRPPLSLLQGFNIKDESGLNNLIAVANSEFSFKHGERFTAIDYQEILEIDAEQGERFFGASGGAVEQVIIQVPAAELNVEQDTALVSFELALSAQQVPHLRLRGGLEGHGFAMSFATLGTRNQHLFITIDSNVARSTLPEVERVITEIRRGGIHGLRLGIEFNESILVAEPRNRQTGLLQGTEVELVAQSSMRLGEISFKVLNRSQFNTRAQSAPAVARLDLVLGGSSIPYSEIRSLVDLLFQKSVLSG